MLSQSQREGLRQARTLLDYLQGECNFSNYIKNEVVRLYWSLLQSGNTGGFRRKRIIGSLTYYVCNRESHGTSMKELSLLLGIDKYKLFKTLKNLRGKLLLPPIVPGIEGLIIKHPDRRPEAPLWTALRPYPPERLRYDTIRHNLRKIAKLAGIDKPVNPHAFRHARATHLCNHLTEAQMKEYFGWTQDSAMASVYIHLSGRDVDKALLKMHGIVIDEEGKDEAIKLVPCDRCGQGNAPTNKYCGKCGLILDVKEALEVERLNKEKDEVMNLILSDPDIKRLAIEKLKVRHG